LSTAPENHTNDSSHKKSLQTAELKTEHILMLIQLTAANNSCFKT